MLFAGLINDILKEIDPELEKAYRAFLGKTRLGFSHNGIESLLSKNDHNEVLVSNPTISAIFTDDIKQLPTEYLIKAQEEHLPIVVINV